MGVSGMQVTKQKKWLILTTLYSVVFLNHFGYFITIPLLVKMIMDPSNHMITGWMTHTFGDYIFSIVLGAGSLSALLFAPVLGRFSDQIGRKKVLIFCTILTVISFIIPVVSIATGSMVLFTIGNFINGISSNNQPIAQAAITDISQKRQNKAIRFSIDTIVICVAMTLGPMVGELLSDTHLVSWFTDKTPFMFAGLLSLCALILLFYALPETNVFSKPSTRITYHNSLGTFTDIFKVKASLLRCLLVFFLAQTAWAQFYQYFYLYLEGLFHFSTSELATYNSLIGVYLIFGLAVIYPFLIKKVSFRRSVSVCLFVCLMGALIIAFVHQPWAQWLGIIPLAIGIGMYFPSLLTLFSEYSSKQEQGWIMSVSMGLISIGWLLTGFAAIWLSRFTAYLPMQAIPALLFIAFAVMWYENRQHEKERSAGQ